MKVPLTWLKDYVKTDASPREIAASFTQLGLMLDKPLDDSGVLDLEHRMDRADWLSIIGCTRDYAAFSNLKLNYPKTLDKSIPSVSPQEMVEISVKTPHVNRFNTRIVKNLKVGVSPTWLKERLNSYGIKSINNIVDITNFVMVEYGQPMHAQDLSKLEKHEITLRPAKTGEQLTTILGTTVKLNPDIFVLSSGGVATVIGGIVGGLTTSVTSDTKEIILDAGNYDQRIIRKNSRSLKIINETVSRYDKFLHPDLCAIALDRASYLLETIAGGKVYHNYDYYPKPVKPISMTLTLNRLKALSGMDIKIEVVKRILTALEYQITNQHKDYLTLTIPYFRTDIEVEDDIVADILRINDYSQIPSAPLTTPVPVDITPRPLSFEDTLRNALVAQGAHEHITTSLVQASGLKAEILLSNALSSDQNALRLSLVPKLEEILINYSKHKITAGLIFEIGKVFTQHDGKYLEERALTVVSTESVNNSLATLMHELGIPYTITESGEIQTHDVVIGEIKPTSFTLYPDKMLAFHQKYQGIKSEFSHEIIRDLSFIAKTSQSYAQLSKALSSLSLTCSYTCKEVTPLDSGINYLLTFTWPESTSNVEIELAKIVTVLTKDLSLISKS